MLQLKNNISIIGSSLKRGEFVKCAVNTIPISEFWFKGLELAVQGLRASSLSAEVREEWQRLIPFIVKSFQLAKEIILKDQLLNQASLDQMYSLGLGLPLRFLMPFGDVAAKWQLKCTLQAVRLLFSQKERRKQCDMIAEVPNLQFLVPSQDVELDILQSAADMAKPIGENQICYVL